MTDTPSDPTNPGTETGFTTRTDVGGVTGTQGDANPSDAPVASPSTETTPPPAAETQSDNANATTSAKPGEPLGDNAPSLAKLQNQACPNCTTGVLYVTRYDPTSVYEVGQGAALAAGHESGGAYDVECRACGFTDSRAFNPGKQWGR